MSRHHHRVCGICGDVLRCPGQDRGPPQEHVSGWQGLDACVWCLAHLLQIEATHGEIESWDQRRTPETSVCVETKIERKENGPDA